MKHSLDIVDELLVTLNALKPLKPEDKNRLDKKFRLEFNYNSNHMEGNTLTYGETELLIMFDDTMGNHTMREYEEVKAHDLALHLIEELARDKERPLTEQTIKELNEIILVRPYWKDAITPDGQNTRRQIKVGSYKEFPNSVRLQNGELFQYASPTETPALMLELVNWYRSEEGILHPLTLATMLHYKFVRIHPFDDGNGRIARLLMNYVLLKNDYPPVIIKSADKQNYLRVLHLADIGDYAPLIDYVAQQAVWSLEVSIKAAKGESLEETDDFIKEIELIKRKGISKGISKSPNSIIDIYNKVFIMVVENLSVSFDHFDELFSNNEESFSISYNNGSGVSGSSLGVIEDEFNLQNQFSQNNEIKQITWIHKMYNMIADEHSSNVSLSFDLLYKKYTYIIQLNILGASIYETEKKYSDSILDNDLNEIDSIAKKSLLDFIKKKVN